MCAGPLCAWTSLKCLYLVSLDFVHVQFEEQGVFAQDFQMPGHVLRATEQWVFMAHACMSVTAGVCWLKHVSAVSHLLFMSCAMRESTGTTCYPEEPGCSAGVSWLSPLGQKIQTSGIS